MRVSQGLWLKAQCEDDNKMEELQLWFPEDMAKATVSPPIATTLKESNFQMEDDIVTLVFKEL